MNVTCIVQGQKFIQTVCSSREILYQWMNLFDRLVHPTTTVTLKPANIPALGYNNYRNFVSSGAFDVSLQCFSSSRPWKYYAKVQRERFSKGGRYSPTILFSSFSDSMLSSRSVLRVGNGFYHCKHDENGHTMLRHYVTTITMEQKNTRNKKKYYMNHRSL